MRKHFWRPKLPEFLEIFTKSWKSHTNKKRSIRNEVHWQIRMEFVAQCIFVCLLFYEISWRYLQRNKPWGQSNVCKTHWIWASFVFSTLSEFSWVLCNELCSDYTQDANWLFFALWLKLCGKLIGRFAFFHMWNTRDREFSLQSLLPKILAIYVLVRVR